MPDDAFLNSQSQAHEMNVYSLRSLRMLSAYRKPQPLKSSWQILSTFGIYALCWALAFMSLQQAYALSLLFCLPAALMVGRMFAIQHDCGHGSLYASRRLQDWIGCLCSLFTLIPYHYWRKVHAVHHADLGNLDRRSPGEFPQMTLAEYQAAPHGKRRLYRLFRNPWTLLLLVPGLMFFLAFRRARKSPEFTRFERRSVYLTNLALLAKVLVFSQLFGFWQFVLIQVPIQLLMGTLAVWMFYIQHHYEHTHWSREQDHNFFQAAIKGSVYVELPGILHWATGNSGYHYLHHLAPMIPNYNLARCHREHPRFHAHITTLSLTNSFRTLSLALWDESQQRLISFTEADAFISKQLHVDQQPQCQIHKLDSELYG